MKNLRFLCVFQGKTRNSKSCSAGCTGLLVIDFGRTHGTFSTLRSPAGPGAADCLRFAHPAEAARRLGGAVVWWMGGLVEIRETDLGGFG